MAKPLQALLFMWAVSRIADHLEIDKIELYYSNEFLIDQLFELMGIEVREAKKND